ncbi:MAG: hypothetical protein GXY02_08160 [Actinobacteria bacterium]|nr:hypothetical protein [Actinomycetota bacterium]
MHKKAAASGVLVVLLLAALLGASSLASAKPRALRYRIVRHTRSFDVVKGHGKRLVVRRHVRYVRVHGVRRYRVVRRHRRSMLLRRLPRTARSTSGDTPITSGSAEPAGLPATASSAQEACPASNGNDGVEATRWEAGSPDYPQWWALDLGSVKTVTGVRTSWHSAVPDGRYQYRIETSVDGASFTTAVDRSANRTQGLTTDALRVAARYVRILIVGASAGALPASVNEVIVFSTDAPPAPPADRYVARCGSDATGDGSASRPWRTIQKAAESVTAGAVVAVGPGVYDERVVIPSRAGGDAGAPTRFVADGKVVVAQGFVVNSHHTVLDGFEITPGSSCITDGQRTVGQVQVTGSHATLRGLYIHDLARGTGITIAPGATHTTIEDCTISRPRQGGIGSTNDKRGPSYTTVRNCTITKWAGEVGIDTVGDHWTVEGCTLRGVTASDYQNAATQNGDGIWTNHSTGNVIRGCRIYDIWSHEGFARQHADCIQFWTSCRGLVVEGCTLGSWKPGGAENTPGPTQCIMLGTISDGSSCDITVRNSLLLCGVARNTHPTASGCTDGTLDVTLINNTFFSNYPELAHVTRLTARNNVFYSHRGFGGVVDADHNAFLWNAWEGGGSTMSAKEGPNSLGTSYATRLDAAEVFVDPSVDAAHDYGLGADFRPRGVLADAGDPARAPSCDLAGVSRGCPPGIGAFR